MNAAAAAVIAKADALAELHPRLFAVLLAAGGVLLIMAGAGTGRGGQVRQPCGGEPASWS